ncbi:MAG: hypothetical protein KGL34_09090, partial [Gammaproteobacteria bacterium]|nr:hypothetical protein [Gammaproteobacteria bacterium]
MQGAVALCACAALCGAAASAGAATVLPSSPNLAPAPGSTLGYSYQFLGSSTPSSVSGNYFQLGVPGLYFFNDYFSTPQTTQIGTSAIGPYDFMDSYVFTVGANAQGDVLTATLGLAPNYSMSDLQFRLYEITSSAVVPTPGGIPSGSTLVQSWVGSA